MYLLVRSNEQQQYTFSLKSEFSEERIIRRKYFSLIEKDLNVIDSHTRHIETSGRADIFDWVIYKFSTS